MSQETNTVDAVAQLFARVNEHARAFGLVFSPKKDWREFKDERVTVLVEWGSYKMNGIYSPNILQLAAAGMGADFFYRVRSTFETCVFNQSRLAGKV